MLGKLLKYDFRSVGRSMLPIYLASVALTTVCATMARLKLDESKVYAALLILLVAFMTASFLGTVVLLAKRFRDGLLRNEGYLSFALPVSTSAHIASKLLNALLWAALQTVVLGICAAIMVIITGDLPLKVIIESAAKVLPTIQADEWGMFAKALLLFFVEIAAFACLVYLCQAIGHLFPTHKGLWEAIAFVVIVTVRGNALRLVGSPFSSGGILGWILLPAAFSVLYLLVTWFILDRRLNLE